MTSSDIHNLQIYNQHNEITQTPLHVALKKGNTCEIWKLLNDLSEDDINVKDKFGFTPLHLALLHPPCNLDLIKALLKHGASVHEKNISGETPLHMCIRNEQSTEVVKELLKHGADVNAKDLYNETPLQMALSSNEDNLEIIKELLTYGANVLDKNYIGQAPLHIAIEKRKDLFVIKELLKHEVEVNAKDMNNLSPLHLALSNSWNSLNIIRELLNYGASVHEKVMEHRTPLHIALEHGMDFEIINELLKYGADVNALDSYHMTPLFIALSNTSSDNLDIVRTLIQYGAEVNIRNIKGQSPLHVAIESGNSVQIIQELLKKGAEVNVRDLNFMTPLRKAMNRIPLNFQIIRELLKYGASIHEKDTSNNILNIIMQKNISLGVIQELLKFALIEHSNFQECTFCNHLYSNCPYSKDYKNEVDKMKKIYVLDQLTLYDFVVHKYDYDKLYMRELDELSKFSNFQTIVQKEFPLYYDIILDTIETKAYLLRKLCDRSLFIKTDVNPKVISLNTDCLCEIGKYLSRDDLRNFIKAINFKR